MNTSRNNSAFTFVELLVVLGITAFLACTLLPALAKSSPNTHAFQCVNNLRQLMNGWKMYSDDYQGRLVPNRTSSSMPGNWVKGFMDFSSSPENTNINNLVGSGALLGPYVRSASLFKCPADKSTVVIASTRMARVRSISMNGWVGEGTTGWNGSNYRLYQKASDIVTPTSANLWVLIDEHQDSINDGWFATAPTSSPASASIVDYPAASHDRGCGISFADGRAEIHRWRDPRTMPPPDALLQFNIPSPNNLDIYWLNQHATSPP